MPWLSLPVDPGSVYFILFYYWLPQVQAAHKCLCRQQGEEFPGLCFGGGKSCFRGLVSVCCQFSPPNPVSESKQSLLLGVKIPFLHPHLAFLENALAHPIDEALLPQHGHSVVAHGCVNPSILFSRVSGPGSQKGACM